MDRILQVFQNDLTCSICRNCFVDPITTDCGHSFCRPCFYLSWPNRSVLAHCSECQKEIQQRDFHTNVILKEMVLIVKQGSLWLFLRSTENRCMIHMEAKQIFCEDQRSLLCINCSISQEHGAHRHCSIGEAAEQHREKLLKTMCSVWEKCRENDRNLNVEIVTTRSWKIYVTSQREAIRVAYDELAPTEPLKKHHHLERLQREYKKIFDQLRDSEASMENKRELLRVMYAELKEMCHKPDVQLLLDFGDILHKSEAVCEHMPQPVKAELTAVTIPGMMTRFNHLQRNINVYHGRALNHEFLQGDLISLNIGWGVLSTPFNFSRSDCFLYLGNSIFTYGQHYWELEVGDTWNWALGVCCDDWVKNHRNLQKAFYVLGCAKDEMHHSIFTVSPLLLQCVPKPIGRVGISLDYEGKSITFVNVAQSSLICRISSCSFSLILRAIFCCCHSQLSIEIH